MFFVYTYLYKKGTLAKAWILCISQWLNWIPCSWTHLVKPTSHILLNRPKIYSKKLASPRPILLILETQINLSSPFNVIPPFNWFVKLALRFPVSPGDADFSTSETKPFRQINRRYLNRQSNLSTVWSSFWETQKFNFGRVYFIRIENRDAG